MSENEMKVGETTETKYPIYRQPGGTKYIIGHVNKKQDALDIAAAVNFAEKFKSIGLPKNRPLSDEELIVLGRMSLTHIDTHFSPPPHTVGDLQPHDRVRFINSSWPEVIHRMIKGGGIIENGPEERIFLNEDTGYLHAQSVIVECELVEEASDESV